MGGGGRGGQPHAPAAKVHIYYVKKLVRVCQRTPQSLYKDQSVDAVQRSDGSLW